MRRIPPYRFLSFKVLDTKEQVQIEHINIFYSPKYWGKNCAKGACGGNKNQAKIMWG